jgi:hypothetical protein
MFTTQLRSKIRTLGRVHIFKTLLSRLLKFKRIFAAKAGVCVILEIYKYNVLLFAGRYNHGGNPRRRITVTSSSNEYPRISWELGWW